MEQYPEIPGAKKAPLGQPCIAFYKYDGSNLRWEWSKKRGWHKFGTRTELFSPKHPLWGQALPLFREIAHDIEDRIYASDWKLRNIQRITVFTEFFGPSSFAGTHVQDEQKELKLIDVYLFKQGMVIAPVVQEHVRGCAVRGSGDLRREPEQGIHHGCASGQVSSMGGSRCQRRGLPSEDQDRGVHAEAERSLRSELGKVCRMIRWLKSLFAKKYRPVGSW